MSADPLPPWVAATLIDQGLMTTDRVTKKARPRRCKTCGLYTLTGLDDLLPTVVHVDPQPLSAPGEAFAQLTGRRTFGITYGELSERTASRINHANADQAVVHAEHSCHSPPLPPNPKFKPADDQTLEPPF